MSLKEIFNPNSLARILTAGAILGTAAFFLVEKEKQSLCGSPPLTIPANPPIIVSWNNWEENPIILESADKGNLVVQHSPNTVSMEWQLKEYDSPVELIDTQKIKEGQSVIIYQNSFPAANLTVVRRPISVFENKCGEFFISLDYADGFLPFKGPTPSPKPAY